MTNASINKTFTALSIVALSVVLAVGVFATTVHAQEDDLGYVDTFGDNLGYADTYGDNLGYADTYGDNLGYADTYGDNLGYGDTYGDNLGYVDTAPDVTDTYDTYDTYGTQYVDESGIGYSYTPTFSAPTSYGGYASFAAPSFSYPSAPIAFNAPSYRPVSYPTPRPAPAPVVTTPSVTNVNNNTNTNVNNITNNNNSSAIAIATVAPVAAAPVQYPVQYVQPTYVQPSCTITISNYNGGSYGPYAQNQLATLTWSSQYSTSGYISPSVGSVSGYGSMQVYPTNGSMYTMTVYGQGGSATCTTQPFYMPMVNNPAPYVSLSQIPYTGFDFGTLGNAIYWLSLMVFAGAAAYLVLYFNGGALATLGGNRSRKTQITMPKITISKAPVAAAKVEAPVVSPIQLAASASRNTSDTMHVAHSKAGSMPRIHISRE